MRSLLFKAITALAALVLFLSGGVALAGDPSSRQVGQASRLVWDIQRVEDVHGLVEQMGDHAAVYDSSGTLHVAYGGDHLYYARCTTGNCTVETVDGQDYVGLYASLALDSQGHPHIAYYDLGLMDFCDDEKVKYAAWDGSQWDIQVVVEGCLGKYPSIAVDAQDAPHISYFDEVSDDLQMADWDGSGWHTYTPSWLPDFEFSGYPSSLLVDTQGRLHLAFIAGHPGEGTVWYIQKSGDTWGTLFEADEQPGASQLGMALDSSGNPHLSYNHRYFDAGLNQYVVKLSYTRFDGNDWLSREEVADIDHQGWTSITIGANDNPRLAYKTNGGVASVARNSGGWGAPAAVPNTDGTERMYLGQISSSSLGLTFYSGGVLQNAHSDSPAFIWSAPSVIDSTGWVGNHIAMVASAAGDLHVVYTDQAEQVLRYAHRPAGGSWQHEKVLETAEDYFIRSTDIDLDTNGRPHIVYQEYYRIDQRSVLKYVSWSGSAWVEWGAVSQASHGGCAPSLELDGSNIIYIAYHDCDYSHNNLALASYDGSWHYQPVDPDQGTVNASLYVNDFGFIYISYHLPEYPAGTLRYAKKEGTVNWVIKDVTTTGAINTSLALDSSGKPRIAFVVEDFPDYDVKLAYWDGQQWLVETVKDMVSGSPARLAIDAQDRWHVAFTSWRHPSHAVKEGAVWEITDPVDQPPADPDFQFAVTSSLAIAFGSDGLPVIVYDGELDLKAAQQEEEFLAFLPLAAR